MELELGLKITRTREDVSSSVDFHFSKDPFGPLVLSQETDSRFIIIIHIKGFKKEGIEIDINKEGNRITVRGRKPVEEMVMIRWVALMREVEFRVFKKVFRIPDIVDLDMIKARFNGDDATLTITMPKIVKGVSGFRIEEEEEEEEEERMDFGDVSEAGEVEEESINREKSDEHFVTEIQREEEFGERESQVLGEEQKDEEETEDDHLDKIHQTDEQDYKILQEEEEDLADSNEENEDTSLRKVPDIEGRDSHEQTKHEEQELVVEQQAETKNDDFGSRVLEEIGDLEPDVLDRKTKSGAMEKELTDDDDADGLSMVQEIGEPERHNEERKIREMVEQKDEEETEDDKFDKIHQIDEQDYKIIECIKEEEEETTGLQELAVSNKESEYSSLRKLPDIEGRDQLNKEVVEQQDSQAETNSDDFGSRAFEENEEQEPDEQLDRTSESGATEKKTTDDDGDGSSKVQGEFEEAERYNEERKNKEMVEGETGGLEKKKIVKMEFKNRDSKEEVDGKMGEGFTPNIDRTQVVGEDDIAEADTKAEVFESDKLQEDKVDKIHELVEKKEEEGDTAKVRRQSEDRSLIKLKDKEEEHSKGQRRHGKQEKIKELVEEKTPEAETKIGNAILKPVQETEVQEVDTLGTTGDEGKEGKNGDAKEDVDAKMGKGLTANIAETATKAQEFESDKLKVDEVDKIQKLVEKKEEEEEIAKLGTQSEDVGEKQLHGKKRHDKEEKIKELVKEQTLETNIGNDIPKPVHERCEEIKNQPEEYKEKIMETGKKINDAAAARKVQEIIKQQELDETSRCEKESKTRDLVKSIANDEKKEEREIAETETKEQESYRPKILGEQEKIQEIAEEKANFSKNRKVKEEEEIAEKKTEFGDYDDDISRKVQDTEQRASDAMKEQEEKVSDGGNGIIAVADTKAEDGKSKNVQEIDEQQTHEEDRCGKQFQKLIGGEISGPGGVEDVEKEKRISDSLREPQEIGKKDSDGYEEYRGIYRNEHEEEKKEEADRPEKITGMMEQELVNLNSQLKQDNVEDGEKTRERMEEKIKDCKEEEGSEKSKTKTDDDIVRKAQGIKEQELYEPKGGHVSKIKELVEEKTDDHEENEIAESKIEAECGSLRKVAGSEEKELHEQKIHKERDNTQITGADEPSGYEKEEEGEKFVESMPITENVNSVDVQEIKKERSDKTESHEKLYKIQEVVEAGHDDHKEGKVMAKAELEIEEESSKKVRETEKQEYDGLMRSMVQEEMQETEETEKDRATEEKEIVERREKTKDDSLKNIEDDEDPELSKPYKRQKEDKIQELVEMGTSDYREKVNKQDEDDILRSQETGRPDLGEPSNIRQLVGEELMENIAELRGKMEDDSSEKFHEFEEVKLYEDWTHEEREKRKYLVKQEVTDPKDKHTVGEGHNDDEEKQQDEKVIAKAELKTEEDSSKKVQEIEKQECGELKRSVVQDKMQETEEKYKTRAMEENDIVERRKKTKGGNLRKVRGDEDPKLRKPYKRPELDEFEGHSGQENIPHLVGEEKVESNPELGGKMEDDSSGKFQEFKEGKSWTYEQREKRKNLVKEEETNPKDRHSGGKGHNNYKEEGQQEKVISKAEIEKQELKSEEDSSKNVREIEKQENDGLKKSMVEEKMQETEEKDKTRAMDENEILERREKTKDGILRKVREDEDPQLGGHGEEDRIQELVETDISDHREKVKKKDEDGTLRSQDIGKLDLGEPERYCKPRKIHHSVKDEKGEGKMENISEPGGKMEDDDSSGKVHEFLKQKPYEDWRQAESEEIKNLVKEKATDPKDKHTGGEGEHEKEERYEKVAETKTKVEDEINKKAGDKKEPELDKHEPYEKQDKLEGVASDCEKEEENLVDDFTTKIQETDKKETHELEMHEKLDIVPDSLEDETADQEDEEAEEAAALVASNESSRKVQTIEEKSEKHKEQNKIPEISDPKVTEEDKETISEKETKEEVPNSRNDQENKELGENVQELEGKTENCNYDDEERMKEEKGKQGKTADTVPRAKTDDGIRKIQATNVEESDEKKNQERKGKIDELVTEDKCLREGQEFFEKEPNVSKRRTVEEEKFQELKEVEKRDHVIVDEEKAEAETKLDDGKSRNFEMSKMLELDESKENEKQKKILKPMEEKSTAPEIEKEGNGKIAEDEIDSRIEDQEIKGPEPYELLKSGEQDNIPQYRREEEKGMEQREIEEMKRTAEDVSSRKVQQIKAQEPDGLDKHQKLREIQENRNIQESMGKETQEHGEEEMNEGGGYKTALKTRSIASSQSQDVEEKESDQPERYAEQEKIQELMTEEEAKEEYRIREGEQNQKAKIIPQVESKANDDSLVKNETERHESTGLRGDKKKENHQELVEIETSDQRKEEKEDEVVEKAETIDEYDCSRKIHEHEELKSDKMSDNFAEEETSNDKEEKEGNIAGKVLGEVETKIGKVRGIKEQEQDKKRSFVEKDTSGKVKETKSRDDSLRKKTQENEKQESHEQKRNEEHDNKKLGQVGKKTNYFGDEDDGNEDKEIAEEEVPRKLKEIEKRESTKKVERNEDQGDIEEMVEEKMNNQEGEDEKSMITEVLANAEDHESKGPEGRMKQGKNREQRIRDKLKDEETAKTETKSKDNESKKIHQIREQGRVNELEEDRTHYCRDKENREKEYEDGSSRKIQEIDKEESVQPRIDDKREKIQELVDKETSEDDEEELKVEFEDEEEDWEAEVIQEMDSDEDNDNIKQIKRIRLGFRLVGGSTLFMSLIVIVISFIRSKRKIRCYKF